MGYAYDPDNIFAKIARGEIPNDTVLETAHSLAFNDIGPQAPVHVLVIPKGPYVNWDHFVAEASAEEVLDAVVDIQLNLRREMVLANLFSSLGSGM